MKPFYIVVYDHVSIFEVKKVGSVVLSGKVNEKIKQGYRPVGGVGITSDPRATHGDFTVHFFQAMVLTE